MALNLAGALRAIGVDVVVWTPYPIPPEIRWWRRIAWVRKRITEYVKQDGRFDIVDVPPVAVTRTLARQSVVITRNVQPELLYLWTELQYGRRVRPVGVVEWIAGVVFYSYLTALVLAGWYRAQRILCLGSIDYDWMKRRFPQWRGKLAMYVNAVGENDRERLLEVRRNRVPKSSSATRFLWLGRWAAHKGPDLLLEFVKSRLKKYPEDRFTIAGCGQDATEHFPAILVGDERVQILPAYKRQDLPEMLASHDVGLFTSRVEGWGLTLQEMLESGMPVYATDAGAVADLAREFPNLARNYPPKAGEQIGQPDPSELPLEYLARFSWGTIATGYLERIHERL